MSIEVQFKVEHKTVELKAKVDDLEVIRRELTILGAKRVGTFRQIDVYFNVPEGRLKLREVEDSNKAELIYYKRENTVGPKKGDVFILKVQEAEVFKNMLERLLETSAIVEKFREMYRYQGTRKSLKYPYIQIHLDTVRTLGTFVEFEMKSSEKTKERDKKLLKGFMKKLGIEKKQLVKVSYADLMRTR